ncbi:hypothetical protein [Wohlfahrtiimonas chitiniclastica]|uniref:hypothetical protein n=1 Tax=Wohlfahrtiimonas chitiniclastica TaxID=400946 RepID=UPI000B98C93C|nr:hypothetical protein [Wohlfahrtiimonas chitiniclastica]OYQ76026.1 hypothetical protein B9T18_01340 [Wohlfahrtiimonas chitiniclastica]
MTTKKKPITSLIYLEGDTEARLLKELNIVATQIKIINFAQRDISRNLATFKSNTYFFIILDMDILAISKCHDTQEVKASTDRIIKNIDKIIKSKKVKQIYFIPQYYDLEDEISRSCGMSVNTLLQKTIGKKKNKDHFKESFLKSTTPLKLLSKAGFDESKLWLPNENLDDYSLHIDILSKFILSKKVICISFSQLKDILER